MASALLLLSVAVVVAFLLTGERHASLSDLEREVAAGEVHEIEVAGALAPRATGFTTVQVRWRDGLFTRFTEVVESRPRSAARSDRHDVVVRDDDVTPRVVGAGIGERLQQLQPGLRVEESGLDSGLEAAALDFRVRGWVAGSMLGLVLATLALLILGPEPRRATRWAWFWLLFSPVMPLVAVALVTLGSHLSAVPKPAPAAGRLRGGWAFLIAFVLGWWIGWGS